MITTLKKRIETFIYKTIVRAIKNSAGDIVYSEVIKAMEEDSFNLARAMQRSSLNDSAKYVLDNIPIHTIHEDRFSLLRSAIGKVSLEGLHLEFGVFKGDTINFLAKTKEAQIFYGFDSFQGLSKPWLFHGEGMFDLQNHMPNVLSNVKLIPGLFSDTLPSFLRKNNDPCAFVHIDSDLFDSAHFILEQLTPRIVPSCIIVFDEFLNFPNWRLHEFKAFNDWIKSTHTSFEYIGYTYQKCTQHKSGQQVAIRIID